MKKVITALLLVFQAAALAASGDYISFREMDVNIGARGQGMANAFTAAVDDSTSVFWNPACLSKIRYPEATVSYNSWFLDTSIQYATGAVNTQKKSGFGAGIVYINMGEIEFIDDGGFMPDRTLRPFSLVLTAGYGARAFDYYGDMAKSLPDFSLSLGCAAKGIISSDGTGQAGGIFLDLGLITDVRDLLSIGASLKNLGFVSSGAPPITASAGIYAKLLNDIIHGINLAMDVKYGIGGELQLAMGAEYSFATSLFLRAGYCWQSRYKTADGTINGVNGGIGFKMQSFMIDYSVSLNGGLGVNHIFSVKLVNDAKPKI